MLETRARDLTIPSHAIKAKGVEIRLPVSLHHSQAEGAASSEGLNGSMTGLVKGAWIQWKSQEWQDVTVPLTLTENTLFLPEEMKLPIWGGVVILEEARIRSPYEKSREITLRLRLEGLEFSEITRTFTPLSLPGVLEGDFSEIRVSADRLATRGNLTIHALGGQIEVRDFNGTTPFSRFREVSMDVLLKDLDLEEASRSFKFGQMGGLVQGRVEDLTFSFGQPERFEFEIQSVKKKGVRQYVNAKAVNNLSILSTGSPFSFKRGVLRFFKSFPYAKLGIYCKLENDIFTLRGTIHQRGVEYLIRRGGLGGIDVVQRDPENKIRWKQMLRRLKAIGRGMGEVEVSPQQ